MFYFLILIFYLINSGLCKYLKNPETPALLPEKFGTLKKTFQVEIFEVKQHCPIPISCPK